MSVSLTPVGASRLVIALALLAGGFSQAGAQETQPSPTAAAPEDVASSEGLGDIVVTANKRSERLQDVPIAIQAVTGAQLAQNRIATTQDLQILSPSLVYNQLGGFAQPFLRGIGSDVSSPNVDPSVATYIDGAFLADSQSTITNLLGVERIEVVSGPQGTLYGRNAVGGAINIITLTPKQDFESRASLTVGNLDTIEGNYRISGGVSDTLALGLYVAGSRRDSLYHRFGPDVKSTYAPLTYSGDRKHQSNYGVRLKANWTPSETVRLIGSVEYLRTQSPDASAFRQGQTNGLGYALGTEVPRLGYRIIQTDFPTENHFDQYTATLREEFDLGDYQIVGISSYHKTKGFTSNDLDTSSTPLFGSNADIGNKHFSQEIQLVSPKDKPFYFIVGAYYFRQNSFEAIRNNSAIALLPVTTTFLESTVKTQSKAVFGEATFKPVENLRITLGGRYTHETKKSRNGSFYSTDANSNVIGAVTIYPDADLSYNNFSPKIGIDYKITDDVMLYASWSKAFKSGAFNMASPGDPPVTPEKLTAYEGGIKSTFLGGRLRANVGGYYYDFKDVQVQSLKQGSGGLSVYQNAASAEAYGIEASVAVAITPELRITGQGAWEHTKYKSFVGYPSYVDAAAGNTPIFVDATGNALQRAPKWVGTLAADYNKEMASGGKVNANLNLYYNGGYYWDPSNTIRQDRYAMLNGSIGYTLPDGHWTVSAFASNITNKATQVVEYKITFGTLVADAMPRTYGLTVAYQF